MRTCLLLSLLAVTHASVPAIAAEPRQTAIEAVIDAQIAALRQGNGARAFSYASPSIRTRFGDPTRFMAMVREGYSALSRSGSIHFGALEDEASGPVQHVDLVDDTGTLTQAEYFMEHEPDGSWRIAGCALLKPPQAGA